MTALSALLAALTLNVPFLPQTPALCGGASVAMVFRYWGDRHADVQQFAPLVDRRAGGIADTVLVEAVRQRNWRATPLVGTIDLLRERIAAGQPLILLLEDRPGRFHYVVAVGADEQTIVVHDPTWGPGRQYPSGELARRWAAANYWALLIEPQSTPSSERRAGLSGPPVETEPPRSATPCDRLLDAALDVIASDGLDKADVLLDGVIRACPRSAAAVAELAAVRFAQDRWHDAQTLAEQAVALDPSYQYAWEVLASTRFVQDDAHGALGAWNRTGKPQLDSVVIDGLSRTRYSLVAQVAGLTPNTTLTASAYRLAERRLKALPNQLAVRVDYKPDADGYATVHVAIAERAQRPQGSASWIAMGVRAMVTKEARIALPGWTGQGEVWSGSWRWWSGRPRVAMEFAAPVVGGLGGVSRAGVSWEQQTYWQRPDVYREERLRGSFTTANWLTPDLRYEITGALDSWDRSRRTASVGGVLERRLVDDRLTLEARGETFGTLTDGRPFSAGSLTAIYRTSRDDRGLVHFVDAGVDVASAHAPRALWSGAGDGHARMHLLRAHPLLVDEAIGGAVFGRRVWHVTTESRRWLEQPALIRLGIAGFVDAAGSSRGSNVDGTMTSQVDAGAGLRIRLPGIGGLIRADYARGIRDGRNHFSVGIVADRF